MQAFHGGRSPNGDVSSCHVRTGRLQPVRRRGTRFRARHRSKLNVPAVRLNRPASDGEAQPYAAFFPGAASVDAIEAIENTMAVLCGQSRPCVSHLDHCLPGILAFSSTPIVPSFGVYFIAL